MHTTVKTRGGGLSFEDCLCFVNKGILVNSCSYGAAFNISIRGPGRGTRHKRQLAGRVGNAVITFSRKRPESSLKRQSYSNQRPAFIQ